VGFDVEPEDLRSFGKQVERAAEDAQSAKKYAKTHSDAIGGGTQEGLILHLSGLHPSVAAEVDSVLSRVHTLLSSSARELTRSAGYYEKTDEDQAAKLDATYPASKR
jgi:hypothetical protein